MRLVRPAALGALLAAAGCAGLTPAGRAADPRSEPSLPTGLDIVDHPYPRLRYAPFPGRVPPTPLPVDEIVQGKLGSCFFLSALAAVETARPGLTSGELRSAGDGAYVVTLYGRDGRPRAVAVDDRFPADAKGGQYLARGLVPGEIRPALFEKAFAKLRGGYHAIDGGDASDALRALTGAAARDYDPRKLTPDAAWSLLSGAVRDRLPVEAGTPEFAELKRRTGRDDLAGLIDDHDYAVVGLAGEGAGRVVRLYTPLTPRDGGDAPLDARRLDLPLADFLRDFDGITVGAFPRRP
ncbi:MAG: hypothetical protein KGL53_14110 [Elusimicrobia bacterium]|nr:hypothetical protein [Elusimicrobiota bacterium]